MYESHVFILSFPRRWESTFSCIFVLLPLIEGVYRGSCMLLITIYVGGEVLWVGLWVILLRARQHHEKRYSSWMRVLRQLSLHRYQDLAEWGLVQYLHRHHWSRAISLHAWWELRWWDRVCLYWYLELISSDSQILWMWRGILPRSKVVVFTQLSWRWSIQDPDARDWWIPYRHSQYHEARLLPCEKERSHQSAQIDS